MRLSVVDPENPFIRGTLAFGVVVFLGFELDRFFFTGSS
jgi:hypothetical protein